MGHKKQHAPRACNPLTVQMQQTKQKQQYKKHAPTSAWLSTHMVGLVEQGHTPDQRSLAHPFMCSRLHLQPSFIAFDVEKDAETYRPSTRRHQMQQTKDIFGGFIWKEQSRDQHQTPQAKVICSGFI